MLTHLQERNKRENLLRHLVIAFFLFYYLPTGSVAEDEQPTPFTVAAIDWCPQICPQDAENPGYLNEIIDELFKDSGLKPQYTYTSWSRAVAGVTAGFFDTLLSPSKEEAPKLAYHAYPIARQEHCVYTPSDSNWTYNGPESLSEVRLVIYREHSYDQVLAEYFSANPAFLVSLVYNDRYLPLATEMLKRGRAGAFLFTRNSTQYFLQTNGITGVKEQSCIKIDDLWLGLAPQETKLRRQVRKTLDDKVPGFTASERYQAILAKYHIDQKSD